MSGFEDRLRETADAVGGLNRLSELANLPRRSLGNWLKGTRPKAESLARIADVAGVSLPWLLTGEGTKFESALSRGFRLEREELQRNGELIPPVGDTREFEGAFSKGIELLVAQRKRESELSTTPQQAVVLPRFDVRASAGAGALVVSEDVDEYFSVGRDWLRRNLPPWAPANSVVGILEGMGDSMEPTIRDGDLLMVVQDVNWRVVERGGIFVFSLDRDRLLLKRLQVLDNGDLNVISDNKAYAPWAIKMEELEERVIIHGQVFFAGGRIRGSWGG